MARPPKFSKKQQESICQEIFAWMATGKTIRQYFEAGERKICRKTFNDWVIANSYPELGDQYARARELQADQMFDDCIEIADDSRGDIITDDEGNERTNWERVGRSKLKVDTRKWFLSKLYPRKYGEKKEETQPPQDKPETINFIRGPERKSKADK